MAKPMIVTESCRSPTERYAPHALRVWVPAPGFKVWDGIGNGKDIENQMTYLSCGGDRDGTDSYRPTSGPGRPARRPRRSRAYSRHPADQGSVRWPRSAGGDCAPARWLISLPWWCPMLKWLGRDLHKLRGIMGEHAWKTHTAGEYYHIYFCLH